MKCGRSHDLDVILDAEEAAMEAQKNKRRKTKANTDISDQVADNTVPQGDVVMSIFPQNDASETSAHRPKEDTENVTSGAPDVNRDSTSEKPAASTETLSTSGTTKVMAQTFADETLKRSCSSSGASAEKFHSAYFDA